MAKKTADVPQDVSSALAKLGELKQQLDEMDDHISKQLGVIEARLGLLGIPCSIAIREMDEGARRYVEHLRFGKLQGKWRLLISQTIRGKGIGAKYAQGGLPPPKPLLDCSRDFRAEAMQKHIPRLIATAVEQLQERLQTRRGAVATAESLVAALTEDKQ